MNTFHITSCITTMVTFYHSSAIPAVIYLHLQVSVCKRSNVMSIPASCSGLIWIECKQVYSSGAKEHFMQYYNYMDFALLAFYLCSYALRMVALRRLKQCDDSFGISQWFEDIGRENLTRQETNERIKEFEKNFSKNHGDNAEAYFLWACELLPY